LALSVNRPGLAGEKQRHPGEHERCAKADARGAQNERDEV
jgi:hypothetical protein